MTGRPLIHIGLHKTASSFLQERIFNNESLGFRRLKDDRRKVMDAFVLSGPFDNAPQALTDCIKKERDMAAREGLTFVISHERLSGYPGSGGYDRSIIAGRLFHTFPDARVLIVVREQKSVIRSMYLQYISDGGALSFNRYITDPEPKQRRVPCFSFDFYEYDKLVEHYIRLFGRDSVLVLPYEALKATPLSAVDKLIRFSSSVTGYDAAYFLGGGEVNSTRPFMVQWIRRVVNSMLRSQQSNYGLCTVPVKSVEGVFRRLEGIFLPLKIADPLFDSSLKKRVESVVAGRYGQSNARLQELLDIDLKSLGYELPV